MIKSYIFASMYTVIGMTGWGAYSTISTEDTSVAAIQQIATQAINNRDAEPLPKTLHRWRDHNGNWQYGEVKTTDVDMTNYENELALLRSLPRDALPTQALKQAVKDDSLLALIPSIDELFDMVNMGSDAKSHETQSQQNSHEMNLAKESERLKQSLEQRDQLLHKL